LTRISNSYHDQKSSIIDISPVQASTSVVGKLSKISSNTLSGT
jgi:hypothetical protein